MEEYKDLSKSHKDSARFPWPVLFFVLGGLGFSAILVVLTFSGLRSRPDNTSVAVLSSGSLAVPTDDVTTGGAPAFTTGPSPDPRAGNIIGSGRAEVGQPAPDFTLRTLEGDTVTLSDFAGYPVLINFWATWCAPCRREMPELVRVYNTHEDEGFVVLAVDLTDQDSVDDVRAFVEEFEMNFPVLLDETGAVSSELYRLLGLPMTVFVDREGMITRIHIGIMSGQQIDGFVGEILE